MKISGKIRRPLWGGLIASAIIGVGIYYLGNLSQYEARELLGKSIPGFNMLCNTVVLASATILALLLTVLGISSTSKSHLSQTHYHQVALLAKWDTIIFIAAITLFQFSNIPITEAENFPKDWYNLLYWATLISSSLLCGGTVAVILMLYNTVTNMIDIVGLGVKDHRLVENESLDEE
ncbi:hypothetical protein G3O08_11980 [Cryomorpha ignava]|uniref:DUF2975 domain-containing protein n=1 Tax=Cryomorpha ignava TaxID=101383 RepID=A0A7K3WT43_9FLAO|nr:hypothetical protein [Cryomorpha ignava]NEN24221.1 hypothetical protein [Cryomorpha ignava]